MRKFFDIGDTAIIALGMSYGLAEIETILGVIILSVQLIWLTSKLVVKLVHAIKDKKPLDELDGDIEEITGTLGSIIDKLDEKEAEANAECTDEK